uniref:START domain-containing protein n=1 Tax=Globisporangium ultimum (strain ATCC 200006 / CBS 805.95 / DAOM BR144) TaxID=431595 RepID=K3WTW4_GLOUD
MKASNPAKVYKSVEDVDFHAFGEDSVQILLDRQSGQDKLTTWNLVDSQAKGGVKIWKGQVQGSSWSPFKVSRHINADKATIQHALIDPDLLLKMDDMTSSVRILKSVDEEGKLTLRQLATRAIFPVSAREFVIVTYATTLPDGRMIIASRSLPLEGVQLTDGAVRGITVISGYIIEEVKSASGKPCCDVTLLAHADLAGYIPSKIVNLLGTSTTVKILANLQTVVERM